jgi:signal peptidase I
MGSFFAYMTRIGFSFSFILLALTVFTGLVLLVDYIWQRQCAETRGELPVLIDYSKSFFPVLLIVFLLRSFVAQPYQVPTGSLEPTVVPGDLIFVQQYTYGIKMPVWNKVFIPTTSIKRGDIAVFHYPVNPHLNYVKRVIGLPGDVISYDQKVLTIQKGGKGKPIVMTQKKLSAGEATEPGQKPQPVEIYQENLAGFEHKIQRMPSRLSVYFHNVKVPAGEYFMMGDNRDDSGDSRYWGFVPAKDFIGKASMVFMSWDSSAPWFSSKFPYFMRDKIRWNRIGTSL